MGDMTIGEEKKEYSLEEYKLALFVVCRNHILPTGKELGKTEHEINVMAVDVSENVLNFCAFDLIKPMYVDGCSEED